MFRFINSITKRLFFSFGILVFNIVIITFIAIFFLSRTTRISDTAARLDNERILIINLIKMDLDFLRFETVNSEYFETGHSRLLIERDSLLALIRYGMLVLQSEADNDGVINRDALNEIGRKVTDYNSTFGILRQKIDERGFKDYGVEGAMRSFAHSLENHSHGMELADLLSLRRHEKDFILRKEDVYVDKFNDLANRLVTELRQHEYHGAAEILLAYKRHFNHLVRLELEIGITPALGLLEDLNSNTKAISADLRDQTVLLHAIRDRIIRESAVYFLGVSVFLIVFSLLLTYYTSTRLARPIKKLSTSMGRFIVNEGLDERELQDAELTDEVSALSQSFIKLSRKLKMQFQEIVHQNNELRKLNTELDRFIYSAAHDLKSPLASLHGLIRLAEIEIQSEKHAHYFGMMSSTVKKLDGFIGDITDYARNKRQQLKIETVDLTLMVEEILESLKFLPHADRIKVTCTVKGEEFHSDKARLDIVLRNLLSNSFRYMDSSKDDWFIQIKGIATVTDLKFEIRDNGIGIGREHLKRVFEMFYRAVESSQGTGIGLFLVKESVKMLRGRISVDSKLGEFTVFHLYLPNLKHSGINSPESEEVVLESSIVV